MQPRSAHTLSLSLSLSLSHCHSLSLPLCSRERLECAAQGRADSGPTVTSPTRRFTWPRSSEHARGPGVNMPRGPGEPGPGPGVCRAMPLGLRVARAARGLPQAGEDRGPGPTHPASSPPPAAPRGPPRAGPQEARDGGPGRRWAEEERDGWWLVRYDSRAGPGRERSVGTGGGRTCQFTVTAALSHNAAAAWSPARPQPSPGPGSARAGSAATRAGPEPLRVLRLDSGPRATRPAVGVVQVRSPGGRRRLAGPWYADSQHRHDDPTRPRPPPARDAGRRLQAPRARGPHALHKNPSHTDRDQPLQGDRDMGWRPPGNHSS
jgi:hypothetical protein